MAGGAGGAGGSPNGNSGGTGSSNGGESDQFGGEGANSLFGTGGAVPDLGNPTGRHATGHGAGGSGASAKNYAQPLNWAGGTGSPGLVRISW